MAKLIIEEITDWEAFSGRFERRAERLAARAVIELDLIKSELLAAFEDWQRNFARQALARVHDRSGLNILQLKLELLFAQLIRYETVKVHKQNSIAFISQNIVAFPDPLRSGWPVDYRGRLEFQRQIVQHVSAYIAFDFCADIHHDLLNKHGEHPFASKKIGFQEAVSNAVTYYTAIGTTKPSFVSIMGMPSLPATPQRSPRRTRW